LKELADNSVDAVVTDPPYELGFMGKGWDSTGIANNPALWSEVLRVLKPGGHCVAFSGTRTYHRMACAIEDAGFEVRDQIQWVYSQGFPKAHNLKNHPICSCDSGNPSPSGSLDAGALRGRGQCPRCGKLRKEFEGFSTGLKPANEPICLARKPLSEKTVAANVLRWGTGAINVDATRIPTDPSVDDPRLGGNGEWHPNAHNGFDGRAFKRAATTTISSARGRFPANLCHDGSQEVLDLFPESKGGSGNPIVAGAFGKQGIYGKAKGATTESYADRGSAARFFYCAKASKADRAGSKHPTVKPIKLMQWLCRMVCPPGGVILDPFAGSGTTGEAAILEGFQPILIERETEYIADIHQRLANAA